MSDRCLNPDCDREVSTIGVCLTCANDSSYQPKKHGITSSTPPWADL